MNKTEVDFNNWLEKAQRDGATLEEITKYIIKTNMLIPYSFVSTLNKYKSETHPKLNVTKLDNETEYWKQLFYNECEARQNTIDELHSRRIKELFEMAETVDDIRTNHDKYKEVIEQIESWTRNPREYEPSLYSISHMCRDVLGMNKEEANKLYNK